MRNTVASLSKSCALRPSISALTVLATPALLVLAGCTATTSSIAPSANSTSVTLLATSFANDRWTNVTLGLNNVTLISQSGEKVKLLTAPVNVEFTHLSSSSEPIAAAEVQQGTYTGATVDIGSASYLSSGLGNSDGLQTYGADALSAPMKNVSVSFPNPIKVAGDSMALSLDLVLSQSLPVDSSAAIVGQVPFTPKFMIALPGNDSIFATQAAAPMVNLQGTVTSVDGQDSLTVTSLDGNNIDNMANSSGLLAANPPVWKVQVNSTTMLQGINSIGDLAKGVPVNLDLSLSGGSLAATRIAVYDTSNANLTVWNGALLQVQTSPQTLYASQGLESGPIGQAGMALLGYNGSKFAVSLQLDNLADLPFSASFTSANMVPGQLVNTTLHTTASAENNFAPGISTLTLMPQTINGNITAVSQQGNFTVYTVYLAPYDRLAALATQPGQANLLTNPSVVQVYADSSTRMLNFYPAATGGINRFYGLLFNDNGTLRMDSTQVLDGVEE